MLSSGPERVKSLPRIPKNYLTTQHRPATVRLCTRQQELDLVFDRVQIISEARDHTIARHWPHAHIAYRCTGTQQCTAVQRWLHRIHVPDESTHLDCARRSPAHSDTHTRRHGTFTHAAPKRSSPQRRKRSAPMPAAHPHSTGTATAHPPCLRPRPLDVEALGRRPLEAADTRAGGTQRQSRAPVNGVHERAAQASIALTPN